MISQPLFILLSRKRLAETTFAKSLQFAVYYFVFVTKTEQYILRDDCSGRPEIRRYRPTDGTFLNGGVVCTPLRVSPTPDQPTNVHLNQIRLLADQKAGKRFPNYFVRCATIGANTLIRRCLSVFWVCNNHQ